jgi:hypothetical protein
MAKTDTPKKQKPKSKLTDKGQSERIIETARELGVDESGKLFERTAEKIMKPAKISPKDAS